MTPSKLAAAKPRNFYYFDFKHAHKSQHTGRRITGYSAPYGKWGYLFTFTQAITILSWVKRLDKTNH